MALYFYSGFITGILLALILIALLFFIMNKRKREGQKVPPKKEKIPVITLDSKDLEKAGKLADKWESELNEIMNYGGLVKQKYSVDVTKPPYLKGQDDGE